jgi:hypothetical protein
MGIGRARRLVQVELAVAIGGGLAILLLYVAQPRWTSPHPSESLYLLLAAGLYLIGLAWMLEIATEEA